MGSYWLIKLLNRYCDSADNGNNVDVVDKEFAPMIPEKYNPVFKN